MEWLNGGSVEADAFKGAIMGIAAAFAIYEGYLVATKIATELWTAAQWLLNAALNANPLGIVLTLLAAVAGAIIYLWNNNEEFRNWLITTWNKVGDFFKQLWTDISTFAAESWEKITNVFSGIGAWFSEKFLEAKNGVIDAWSDIREKMTEIWEKIKGAFRIGDVAQWGRDMIQNFINGLLEKWNALKETVSGIAGSIKDFLGFSEPKKGPLSDFHTYAPDMMDLFMQGIEERKNALLETVSNAFDFQDLITAPEPNNGSAAINGARSGNSYVINVNQPIATPADMLREIRTEAQYGLMIGEALT